MGFALRHLHVIASSQTFQTLPYGRDFLQLRHSFRKLPGTSEVLNLCDLPTIATGHSLRRRLQYKLTSPSELDSTASPSVKETKIIKRCLVRFLQTVL
jgi:hypothetical protein